MTQPARQARSLIVVLGIDGAGKTTAAAASQEMLPGTPVLVLGNYSGRKSISALAQRFALPMPAAVADVLETSVRVYNVLLNHWRAARFDGVVIMDRHLYCQLALRKARGIRRHRALAALLGILPRPDAVVFFDIPAQQALQRITLRGEDQETLEDLGKFRQGYAGLPGFPAFIRIDASGSPESNAYQLRDIIAQVAAPAPDRP